MRILHINKFFDLHGGAEVYLHRLMDAQQKAGHEVHALSTKSPRNIPSPDEHYFVTRHELDRREGPVKDIQKAIQFVWNQEAKRSVERAIEELNPDVIHLHNIYHHLSTSLLEPIYKKRLPCVQTLHDYKLACPNYKMFTEGSPCERCKGGKYQNAITHHCFGNSFLPNMLAAFEMGFTKSRQSYERTVRLFLCPSRFMKEKMEDWGEPKSKLRYVPNPVELPAEMSVGGGGYLLYVGRLSPEKGLMTVLEALRTIPELPLKIAGRGPEEERLRTYVHSQGMAHVEFIGFQTAEQLLRLRYRAEAAILPTLSYENASGVILEAMAQGVPCLATRIGGNPELVEDGRSGFLVRPQDTEDWTRILRRFLALTPEARRAMGAAGRQRIEQQFRWETHLAHLTSCYQEVQTS